jgi:serine protease Do
MGALSGCGSTPRAAPESARAPSKKTEAPEPPKQKTPRQIAEKSMPAIVSVRTKNSLGTGFIVRKDGWIATNLHVLGGASEVVVTLADKRELPVVSIVSRDAPHDLVILQVEAKGLPVLPLGDSDRVRPGDPVVAIGHPLGLEETVTNGLVSAVRRESELEFLQISAPIAPGSSGGPLFNEQGEVIGVATAILRGGQNLNFGLPVNYVKDLVKKPDPISMLVYAAELAAAEPEMPRVQRKVPSHPVKLLDKCGDEGLAQMIRGLGEAIQLGAPLYNNGDFAACYHVYEGAAADLERRLPKGCSGAKRALSDGRKKAAKLDDPGAAAWVMRDAFDGLLDVIQRKITSR